MTSVFQPAFLAALRAALLVVPGKGLPVLANVLLRSSGTRLTIQATNLDQAIEIEIERNGLDVWECCVPAKVVYELISEIPGGNLTLTWSDYHIKITSDLVGVCGKLAGFDSSDFPALFDALPDDAAKLELHPRDMAQLKRMVLFAVSDDSTRGALQGVLLRRSRKHLEAVATDGFRMGRISMLKSVCSLEGSGEWVVPPEAISLAERLSLEDEIIDAEVSDDRIMIRIPSPSLFMSVRICSKLLDEKYPNYQQVIPHSTAWSATVSRDDLLRAVRRVRVASRETNGKAHILVDPKANQTRFDISGRSSSAGMEGSDSLPATCSGQVPPMAWEGKYLVEVLGLFDSLMITVSGNLPRQATVWREPGDDDARPLIILMPLRREDAA